MQRGKVYKRGDWWMFRYKVPEMSAGKKVWKDRYEKLAPAHQYASVGAIERDGLLTKFHDLLDTSKMTPSTMQLLTDFVEHVYFPAKKASGALKASTLVGYDNLYEHHFKARISGKRMCDFTPRVAQQFVEAVLPPMRASHCHRKHCGTSNGWASASLTTRRMWTHFPTTFENPFFRVKIPKTKYVGTAHAIRHARRGAGHD